MNEWRLKLGEWQHLRPVGDDHEMLGYIRLVKNGTLWKVMAYRGGRPKLLGLFDSLKAAKNHMERMVS